MLTRPAFVGDEAIARAVAANWLPQVAEVTHLPWGFGAHHWRAAGGGRTLFVTLDQPAPRHTGESLEAAYASAAALADAGLAAVCAPLPAPSGRFTVDIGAGLLSATPWLEGRTPSEAEAGEPRHVQRVLTALAALHRAAPPHGLPSWAPRVGPRFAGELRERTARPWTSGPLAEEARTAIAARGDAIERWTRRYLELADRALSARHTWVPTHGEPHRYNQLLAGSGELKLVDWESLALAPPERDHTDLLDAGAGERPRSDPAMAELFRLDWRLSEIVEYARWFAAPHTGTDDDRTALRGLHEELADTPG
ncbi:aminoglycoside phosphotransferase [Streptomyces albus subsp. chlorinus]|uniref:phosphotransferase n=1 Tax=Streptomyces albus TaxID=1888 RepID=UPI0015711967|nr:phosphotransferase [Streptomyces albus]NSC25357.1 aminoglycoside phosphotransferase [Streptomyces albus subsp. chlorinus]